MKLISFREGALESWGVLEDNEIIDLGTIDAGKITELSTILSEGRLDEVLEHKTRARRVALDRVTLGLPLTKPGKILCVGTNYDGHIRETGATRPDYPVIFTRFVDSLVADGAEIIAPRNSVKLDFEGEFVVVIGKTARHVSVEDAEDYILGYSILNDGSVRDFQRHTHQFTPGKNFPSSGSFGPVIVTRDEFGPLSAKKITTRLNGITVQEATLDLLIFNISEILSYISEWTELRPGDIISTGTPEGVGAARTPELWMFPGDHVEVEIEGIGILANRITEEV
ncbi:MAG: fumarylacetoacetate hydrolase family protein [Microbacteriaceae bacterium]